MSESAALVVALLILAWAALSGVLGRHSVTGPLVFVVVGYLLANPDWGPVRIDIEVDALHVLAEIDPRARAVLRCVAHQPGPAASRPVAPGATPRDRAAAVDRPRRDPCRGVVRLVPVGARRFHRRRSGAHRCGTERSGDQRPARPDAAPAGAQRGERAQRRHRHPDRHLHAGGRRQPARPRDRQRVGRSRQGPERTRARRRRRTGPRYRWRCADQRLGATGMDRSWWSTNSDTGHRARRVPSSTRDRGERIHRCVRRRDRVRRDAPRQMLPIRNEPAN